MRTSTTWLRIMVCLTVVGGPLSGQATASARPPRSHQDDAGARAQDTVPPLQRVLSVRLRNVSLEDALKEIDRRAGLKLAYSRQVVPLDRVVSLEATNISAGEALERLLEGTGVRVREAAGAVFLEKDDAKPSSNSRRGGALVGRVIDSVSGRGVSNVEVLLADTRWHTVTDTNGWYRLVEIDTGIYVLNARRVGYARRSRRVQVREREDTVNLTLSPVTALQDLITTATGQQRRRDIGNAITTINADSVLKNAPIRNLTDLLENRVPGLTVQHSTGAPGDPARLRLRGIGSVLRSNDPVVIVDGVRVYAVQSDVRSGNLTNLDPGRDTVIAGVHQRVRTNPVDVPAPSPLDQIDPNIIEKIEVFKGPSAATLYGADAANGVIVITTKRGKPGPTRWDFTATRGRTTSAGEWPVGLYRWGYGTLTGYQRFCPVVDLRCTIDSITRFQVLNDPSLTVLGHGALTNLSLTASGGTQAITFSITGTYNDETGLLQMPQYEIDRFRANFNREPPSWMQHPHRQEQWSVRSNMTARLSPTADVSLNAMLTRSEQERTTLENQIASLAGTYVDTLNGIYYRPSSTGDYSLGQTADILGAYYTQQTASLITFTTGLNGNWRPWSWFSTSGQAGVNIIPRDDRLLLPAGLAAPTDSGAVARGTGRSLESTFNVQGSIIRPLGRKFQFTTSFGANLTTTTTGDLVTSATSLVSGVNSIDGAGRIVATENGSNASVFGWYIEPRVSGQRISLSTGLRLDGGSAGGLRLSKSSGLFGGLLGLPKLNGSWVISEEPWFPLQGLFTSLRLRGAYGQAQLQPGVADRLRLYNGFTDQLGTQLTLSTIGNTKLRPERSTEFEGGADADLFDGRVSVEFTAYRKMQVDALMSVALPPSVKGSGVSVLENIGNIRNTGVEFVLNVTPVRLPLLNWSARVSYSRNANTLVKLGTGVEPNPAQGLVEGYPVGGRWARPILGFADQNGDGVLQGGEIQVGDSMIFMGRLLPASTTALSSSVLLFGGALSVTTGFSYVSGAIQIDQTARTNWVLSPALADHNATLSQQASVLASTRRFDPTDYGLMQEISTFRFNELSVNYRAPVSVARWLRAQQITFALKGRNLAMHTNYSGKDPDVNAWRPGENIVDTGQLPQPRTWELAAYLAF